MMKKKNQLLLYGFIFCFVITSLSRFSNAFILLSDPVINTDKQNYFYDEDIHINASWDIIPDENLEIKIMILDYNPEDKPKIYSIQYSTINNCTFECAVEPSGQFSKIFNFRYASLNKTNNQTFWISIFFLKYDNNNNLQELYSLVFSTQIQLFKYTPTFQHDFSNPIEVDFNDEIILNNKIQALENQAKLSRNTSFQLQIVKNSNIIKQYQNSSSSTGSLYFKFNSTEINNTGNFILRILIIESEFFQNSSNLFSLIINSNQIQIKCNKSYNFTYNTQKELFNITVQLLEQDFTPIILSNLTWRIDSRLNISKISVNQSYYTFFFYYPKKVENFTININCSKMGYNFSNISCKINFVKQILDFQLSLREIFINNSISFYLENISPVLFSEIPLEDITMNLYYNSSYIKCNFSVINVFEKIISLNISWDDIYSNQDIFNQNNLKWKAIFLGNEFFNSVESNVLTINHPPVSNFSCNETNIIQYQNVAFTFTGYSGNDPATYFWDFGDGTNSTLINPVHKYKEYGIFAVNLTIFSGDFVHSIQKENYIYVEEDVQPLAAFIVNQSSVIEGDDLKFYFSGFSGNDPATYFWDFGDGTNSTQINPVHRFKQKGNYTVQLNICDKDYDIDYFQFKLTIIEDLKPFSDFCVLENVVIIGDYVNFYFCGSEGNGPCNFIWEFGDNSGVSYTRNPIYRYNETGNFTIKLKMIDANGDYSQIIKENYILVTEEIIPNAKFELNTTNIIAGQYISFNFTGTEGNHPTTFYWDFGDGTNSTERNPVHKYMNHGEYVVYLRIQDGNGDVSVFQEINITVFKNLLPKSNFTFSKSYIIQNEIVYFYFKGEEGNGPSNFFWDFGDGTNSTERNPSHKFLNFGNFSVTLKVEDQDMEISIFQQINCINVEMNKIPLIKFVNESIVTIEGAYVQFNYEINQGNGPCNFIWDFGDGNYSYSPNPIHFYKTTGKYQVKVSIYDINEDNSTDILNVSVEKDLMPSGEIITNNFFLQNYPISFSYNGTHGNKPNHYFWDFGDGINSTKISPTHIYTKIGQFNISLVITDSNSDVLKLELSIEIKADIKPIANFSINKKCIIQGQEIKFNFTGVDGNGPCNYYWDFGDGINSTNKNPIHNYQNEGNFTVRLYIIDMNNDSDVYQMDTKIMVLKDIKPIANFYVLQKKFYTLQKISFIFNGTLGNKNNAITWDFGDGIIIRNQLNITYQYKVKGNYQIILRIVDFDNDSSTFYFFIKIRGKLVQPKVFISSAFGFFILGISLTLFIKNKRYNEKICIQDVKI